MINHWIQGVDVPKDSVFGAVGTIDLYSASICIGELQFISDVTTGSGDVAFLFKIGSKPVKIFFSVSTGLKVSASIIEAVNLTSNGTAVQIRNYNRLFPDNGLEMKVYKGPTYTGGETFRVNQSGFGSAPGMAATGSVQWQSGYVFKPETNYVLLLKPAASTDIVTLANFMEKN
jgi:hypothetical protein